MFRALKPVTLSVLLASCLIMPAFSADPPAAVPTPVAAPAPAHQSTMLVLDGSNSMWGQLKGVNKIVTARDSIRTLLENAHGSINFGLLTYGDKRKNNGCTDFTLVSKPEDYDMVNLLKEVYRINPRGRSPIAAALKKAAANLPKDNAHILLVSDGAESCGGDPCAVAKELVDANPGLQIDVIGFRDEKEAQLECIAENGNGAFVVATDTERLTTLLAGVQAKAEAIQQTAMTTTDLSQNTVTPIDPKAAPGTVELRIRDDNETEQLRANYSIYTPDGTNIVSFTARNKVKEYLQPGTYRIKAIWQNYLHSETITIRPGQTTPYTFEVGATGQVALSAVNAQQQPVNVNYAIYTQSGDFITKNIMQGKTSARLPVGEYRIKANLGDTTQETGLNVSTGQETAHVFVFKDK